MTINATVNGNLGGNGELRYLQDGTPVLEMSIAARGEKPKDGSQAQPQWVSATIFGARASTLAEFAQKGRFVSATGRLTLRHYTTKDGRSGTSLELRVNEIDFGPQVDGGQQRQQQPQNGPPPQQGYQNAPPQQGYQQQPQQGQGWPPPQQPAQGYGPPQGAPPQQRQAPAHGQRRANF